MWVVCSPPVRRERRPSEIRRLPPLVVLMIAECTGLTAGCRLLDAGAILRSIPGALLESFTDNKGTNYMAQRVNVVLVDDIDGSDAAETVTFGLDGVQYEIDLSDGHADELR